MKVFAIALLACVANSVQVQTQATLDFATYCSTYGKSYKDAAEYSNR